MEYTVVIRTLGQAGDKYQKLLDSLLCQTIIPSEIIVYIAEGYQLPKETIGIERYIYVKKGMLAQRALQYKEVNTEYILFLDDDLEFPPDTVKNMFELLLGNNADLISPDIFSNAERGLLSELLMTISGRMRARRKDNSWGYKVMATAGYSYNKHPKKDVYRSETNAGACFLCRKEDFLRICLRDELWLDAMPYPLGEDQVMYYKMHCLGLKQLTWYRHEIVHLDGGDNMTPEKEIRRLYGDVYFKNIFWHRFIYLPEPNVFLRLWRLGCLIYAMQFTLLVSLIKFNVGALKVKFRAMFDAWKFIRSKEYKMLPPIIREVNVDF